MQLVFQANTGNLTVFGLIGGPASATGNNAYVISVNDQSNTGPNTGYPPPPNYYATTTGTYYNFQFNWSSSTIFIANLSPCTSSAATVSLCSL
jgi:hypothetical protein